jgi:hypothetical protein
MAVKLKPDNAGYRENLKRAKENKNIVVWFLKMCLKSNVINISVLLGVLAVGYFFIDAFTPDVTEITQGGNLTVENSARFYVTNALKVKTLDSLSVKWSPNLTANAISVLLPPGSHTFILDFSTKDGDTTWSAKDLKIDADFKSGKYYRFNSSLDKETKNISYSIKETDPVVYNSGKFDPKSVWLIIAAIPFVVAAIFAIIARKKGTVYNIYED